MTSAFLPFGIPNIYVQFGFTAQSAFAGRKDWHSHAETTSLPALKTSFCEDCGWKISGWSILYIIYEAKTTAKSVCTAFQNRSIPGRFLKNTSELHWFNFRKISNEPRCFKCQSNAMAPYTPFLSIEVDIVCPLSSFSIPSFLQLVSPTGKSVPTSATPWHSELNFSAACRNCGRNSAEVS